ncbi:MAG: ABC transporter ATP-binding protein [Acidimicrobiia bacterium]
MSSDVAIRIEGLGKSYRIKHQEQHVTLAEQALDRLRHPFRRPEVETFWALKDIDLEIKRGEVLGLIGRNGAGKSTLLKVLSRITPPTTGRVDVFGRIGSLLEVGTGFHPELTGRENIYLNGSILGMRKPEIERQFDAIVDFAGVERFLDTPVKRYSSGMYVRLAFAVAAHLDTEILLVDEVLAVGDAEFQEKCLGKIEEVTVGGRTVILVSHNLDSIVRLCERGLVLHEGRVLTLDATTNAVLNYTALPASRPTRSRPHRRSGSGEFRIHAASAPGAPFSCEQHKLIRFEVAKVQADLDRYFVSVHIVDSLRRIVAQCDSRSTGPWIEHVSGIQTFELRLETPWLKPGRYEADVFVCNAGIIDSYDGACWFEVLPSLPYLSTLADEAQVHNLVLPNFSFHSLADPADGASVSTSHAWTLGPLHKAGSPTMPHDHSG